MGRDCALIVALWAVAAAILRPFQNTPFSDDWVYAWSVEHLLKTGELKILDNAVGVNPLQVLWGALFCLPVGFSFTALRLSTWTLSAAGLCGLYLTLRELDVARRDAWIGTGTLAVYPVFVILSYTFMTDVPFVVALIWFTYASVRFVKTADVMWFAVSSVIAGVAIGLRPVGALLAAVLPMLAPWRSLTGQQKLIAAGWTMVPWISVIVVAAWYSTHVERRADLTWIQGSPAWRTTQLRYSVMLLHQHVLTAWWFCTGALGIALAPLALPRIGPTGLRRAGIMALVAVVIAVITPRAGGQIYVPLHSGEVWSVVELSGTEHNYPESPLASPPSWYPSMIVPLSAMLFAIAFGCIRFRDLRKPRGVPLLLIGVQFPVMAIVWLFGDNRYILPLVPLGIALVACSSEKLRVAPAAGLLLLLATISAVGVRDHLRYNRALWDAVAFLQASGVPAREINGGWAVNGWLQYAHPENAARAANGDVLVFWINEPRDGDSPFQLTKGPRAGWTVVKTFPYDRWASPSGAIHVLTH